MSEIKELINLYKMAAKGAAEKNPPDLNESLLQLENQMLHGIEMTEGDRMEALANMEECRRQILDEHNLAASKTSSEEKPE